MGSTRDLRFCNHVYSGATWPSIPAVFAQSPKEEGGDKQIENRIMKIARRVIPVLQQMVIDQCIFPCRNMQLILSNADAFEDSIAPRYSLIMCHVHVRLHYVICMFNTCLLISFGYDAPPLLQMCF